MTNEETSHRNMDQDDELLERSRLGDESAFKELILRYQGKVAGVVQSLLGITPESEDVGQEVFVSFYRSIGKFRRESSLGTYLIRMALNFSLNELKRRKKRNLFFTSIEASKEVQAQETGGDLKEQLNFELKRLDMELQAVVILRFIEGYSTRETSEILGIPIGTVLSRLSRAQKKLRIAITKDRA
jgi:RNA polymerase sigma-70 factor, ECF subfamily